MVGVVAEDRRYGWPVAGYAAEAGSYGIYTDAGFGIQILALNIA